jgi:putative membrane protein
VATALSTAPAFAWSNPFRSHATTDERFVIRAANSNRVDVELSRIAARKSSNEQVRRFARAAIAEHEQAMNALRDTARDEHIVLPARIDAKGRALVARLNTMSGHALDRSYVHTMVRHDRSDVTKYELEARKASRTNATRYASRSLNRLETELIHAREVDRAVLHNA